MATGTVLATIAETVVPIIVQEVGPEIKTEAGALITKLTGSSNVWEAMAGVLLKEIFGL